MAPIPTPIRKWIEQFTSDRGFFQSSSDVDHDATSNRTHDGDDIEPDSVTTDALEADSLNITPYASGTVTLSADETVLLDVSEVYESGYWNVFISVAGGDGGGVRSKLDQSSSDTTAWYLEETDSLSITVNWATINIGETA